MSSLDVRIAKALDTLASPVVVGCVECGAAIVLTDRAKLYCSDACHQTLKLVHYGRRVVADERIDRDPLIEEALQMRIAHILAGGYPEVARRVPSGIREQVFARDGGMCVLCGAPATQIDHITGDTNTPENLRAVCGRCNLARAQEHLTPASATQAAVARQLLDRVFAPAPVFPRDDETTWAATNKRLLAERREQVRAHLTMAKLMERAARH